MNTTLNLVEHVLAMGRRYQELGRHRDALALFTRLSGFRELPADAAEEAQARLAALFKTRTRNEWCALLEGTDACFAPVLTTDEAPQHPHNAARQTYIEIDGILQPGPAPRFSRTVPEVAGPPVRPGEHTDQTLGAWGFSEGEIAKLRDGKVV